jgi:hypothetical protein
MKHENSALTKHSSVGAMSVTESVSVLHQFDPDGGSDDDTELSWLTLKHWCRVILS